MILSRQFRALFRFAGWWALPWGVAGAALAVVRWLTSGALPPDHDSPRLPAS